MRLMAILVLRVFSLAGLVSVGPTPNAWIASAATPCNKQPVCLNALPTSTPTSSDTAISAAISANNVWDQHPSNA